MILKIISILISASLFISVSDGSSLYNFKGTSPDKAFTCNQQVQPEKHDIDNLKNLPLVITNAKFHSKDMPVALILSGDGGWFGFEQSIADNLSDLGIPVIGFDSRKYFWNRRSPEETVNAITELLNYYCKEWERDRVLLIGYSFGSEIVPFIVTNFPEGMKSKIVSTVLLSPETYTDFEVHISNMLGLGNSMNTYNVTDEIIKMKAIPTIIIYGEGEKSRLPELLGGTTVKIIRIPGDHHYKFNLPLIIQTMKNNNAF